MLKQNDFGTRVRVPPGIWNLRKQILDDPRLGRVGEWLKPADCKSAAPCGLRRFESFPVHQDANSRARPGRAASPDGLDGESSLVHRRIIAEAMFESGKEGGCAGGK